MHQALYNKYRPRTFDMVFGQEHITATLKNQVASGRVSHAYLFTGTRGTGKTTCAKLLARAVNCERPVGGNPCNSCASCLGIEDGSILDVLELDAASNTGVDNMRAILEETTYPPSQVRRRVYIIDEVHMLSAGAFNALLKTLEEPPEHILFILATTELHRVAATILSRCQRFDFRRANPREIASNLSGISEREGISITPGALELISKLADGSFRDSLSLLERCLLSRGDSSLDESAVVEATGIPPYEIISAFSDAIAAGDVSAAIFALDRVYMDGCDIRQTFERLAAYFRDVLLASSAPSAAANLYSPGFDAACIERDAARFSPHHTLTIITELQKTIDGINRSSGGRLEAELCLIKLTAPALAPQNAAGIAERVASLETKLSSALRELARRPAPAGAKVMDRDDPHTPDDPAPVDEAPPPPDDNSAPPEDAPSELPAPGLKPQASVNRGVSQETRAAILKALEGVVARSAYTYLTLCAMEISGGALTLRATSEIAKNLLDRADSKNAVASAASRILGTECDVRVVFGSEEESPSLGGFDQIIKNGREAGVKIDLN